jgi:hypothetical protein
LLRIHYDWLEAGEVAQRTVARLSEQLRRYLDDQAWLENRRIMGLIRDIEQHAVALRDTPPDALPFSMDEPAPSLDLPMERPLFSPPLRPRIADDAVLEGEAAVAADALFDQVYMDRAALRARIRQALQARNQIALAQLVQLHPLEQGLAELITYLAIAGSFEFRVGSGARAAWRRTPTVGALRLVRSGVAADAPPPSGGLVDESCGPA